MELIINILYFSTLGHKNNNKMDKKDINNGADLLARKERLEKLQKKYSYRTESERLAPFFALFKGLSFFLQILSALFAAGGVLMLSAVFSKTFSIVIILTIGLLIVLEGLKRLSYNEYNRQRNSAENIGKTVVFFCLLFGSLSVGSSFIGAPHTIDYFAAAPVLVDTSEINENYKKQLATNSAYWGKLANEAKQQAELINRNNNRNGVTRSRAVKNEQQQFKLRAQYKDSLIKYASIIQAGNRSALAQANQENKQRANINKNWIVSFGSFSALASLGFEAALFLILYWCSNFEKREIKEAQTLTKGPQETTKDKDEKRAPLVKEAVKAKVKEVVKNTPNNIKEASLVTNSMQIKQGKEQDKDELNGQPKEGDIIPPTGKQKTGRIWVILDEGERLHLCRPCDLKNQIRSNDGGQRAKYFKKHLQTLNNWNNENK